MLRGKTAIITGASRGIGLATVEVFAENHADIWACAHTPSDEFEAKMKELADRNSVAVHPVYFDVTDGPAMKETVRKIGRESASIDVLVNNAGVSVERLFSMTSTEVMRRTMATELGPYGIRANSVSPGFIDTDMWKKRDEKIKEKIMSETPLKRQGSPSEVAKAILFLASDLSSYITAQNIVVDGGRN